MLIRSIAIFFAALAALSAQLPDAGRGRGEFGPEPGPLLDGGARFLSAEPGRPRRVIKNAPYSAEAITETTQTLPDGNRIRQSITVHMYRDSEGRTRTEQPLHTLNGLAPNANLPQVVFINDPVANVNFALNPTSRTATRSSWDRPSTERPAMRRPEPGITPMTAGPGRTRELGRGASDANLKSESLGRQTVEGLAADGVNTTMTIPAGQIGNDQPIQIVTETWYSPDLQMVVLSKRSDPRKGETVTRLSNVSRSEPPHTFFEVPADFKVTEQARPGRGLGTRPVLGVPAKQ